MGFCPQGFICQWMNAPGFKKILQINRRMKNMAIVKRISVTIFKICWMFTVQCNNNWFCENYSKSQKITEHFLAKLLSLSFPRCYFNLFCWKLWLSESWIFGLIHFTIYRVSISSSGVGQNATSENPALRKVLDVHQNERLLM